MFLQNRNNFSHSLQHLFIYILVGTICGVSPGGIVPRQKLLYILLRSNKTVKLYSVFLLSLAPCQPKIWNALWHFWCPIRDWGTIFEEKLKTVRCLNLYFFQKRHNTPGVPPSWHRIFPRIQLGFAQAASTIRPLYSHQSPLDYLLHSGI